MICPFCVETVERTVGGTVGGTVWCRHCDNSFEVSDLEGGKDWAWARSVGEKVAEGLTNPSEK